MKCYTYLCYSCIPWYIIFEYLQSNIIDLDDIDDNKDIEMKEIVTHPRQLFNKDIEMKETDKHIINEIVDDYLIDTNDSLSIEDFKKIL